jgi:hypothetical protein
VDVTRRQCSEDDQTDSFLAAHAAYLQRYTQANLEEDMYRLLGHLVAVIKDQMDCINALKSQKGLDELRILVQMSAELRDGA